MHVAVLRLLTIVAAAMLAAGGLARAETPDEPQSAMNPMAFLPLVASSSAASAGSSEAMAAQVIAKTNDLRAQAGCGPVTYSPILERAAQGHSRDMAANGFFAHTGSDGSDSVQRIQRAGYRPRISAENIAAGFTTADSVVTAWANSAGHRQNMLNCALTEIGVGHVYDPASRYGHYWVQDFGQE